MADFIYRMVFPVLESRFNRKYSLTLLRSVVKNNELLFANLTVGIFHLIGRDGVKIFFPMIIRPSNFQNWKNK